MENGLEEEEITVEVYYVKYPFVGLNHQYSQYHPQVVKAGKH